MECYGIPLSNSIVSNRRLYSSFDRYEILFHRWRHIWRIICGPFRTTSDHQGLRRRSCYWKHVGRTSYNAIHSIKSYKLYCIYRGKNQCPVLHRKKIFLSVSAKLTFLANMTILMDTCKRFSSKLYVLRSIHVFTHLSFCLFNVLSLHTSLI